MESIFKLISIEAIVVADKEAGSRMVEVYPFESLSSLEGTITAAQAKVSNTYRRADGTEETIELSVSATVRAEWLGSPNEMLAPDVGRGESIKLYKAGNSGRFYWSDTGRGHDKRRTEVKTWAFAASNEDMDTDIIVTDKNQYIVELNTKEGVLTIRTSKERGEVSVYEIQLNTGQGYIIAKDDTGNYVRLHTEDKIIELVNADGTHVRLARKDIFAFAEKTINADAEDINIRAEQNVTISAGKDISVSADKNIKVSATEAYSLTAKTVDITAQQSMATSAGSTYSVSAPSIAMGSGTIGFSGAVTVAGSFSMGPATPPTPAAAALSDDSSSGSEPPPPPSPEETGEAKFIGPVSFASPVEFLADATFINLNCTTINAVPIALYLKDT